MHSDWECSEVSAHLVQVAAGSDKFIGETSCSKRIESSHCDLEGGVLLKISIQLLSVNPLNFNDDIVEGLLLLLAGSTDIEISIMLVEVPKAAPLFNGLEISFFKRALSPSLFSELHLDLLSTCNTTPVNLLRGLR